MKLHAEKDPERCKLTYLNLFNNIIDFSTSLLLNLKRIREKTEDLNILIKSLDIILKVDRNCNFEVLEDFQKIRKKGLRSEINICQ